MSRVLLFDLDLRVPSAGFRSKEEAKAWWHARFDAPPAPVLMALLRDIKMAPGKLALVVDDAEAALLETGASIYQRGGSISRPVRFGAVDMPDLEGKDDVRRSPDSLILVPVTSEWLLKSLSKAASWWTWDSKKGNWKPADPRPVYANSLLASAGEWKFSPLRGILNCPTIDRAGRVIQAPGYDKASRLLLDFEAGSFPTVPEAPSKEDARAALDLLLRPFRKLPFVDENDSNGSSAARSVAASALLTSVSRLSMRAAPLHAFDAPAARTGKSAAAEAVGILATGGKPAAMAQGKTDEEDEKRLSTVLYYGDPVILLDNCERPVEGDFLCSMLTQEIVQARILGLSERRVLPSTALVLATGNNLAFRGDVADRVIVCRLDAGQENPGEREFDFSIADEFRQERAALVSAALTVLRAYHAAGRPAQAFKPMGGFEDWSSTVRSALVWLGEPDPVTTKAEVVATDSRAAELAQVMDLWAAEHEDRWISVAEIAQERAAPGAAGELGGMASSPLASLLADVACRGRWSTAVVGKWLGRNRDRVLGGRALRYRGRSGNHAAGWRLETVRREAR